jgi:antitoxin HicB
VILGCAISEIANPHWGSNLEYFLDEEGIREEAATAAIKRVIAWQLAEEMKKPSITKHGLPT